MWTPRIESLGDGRLLKVTFEQGSSSLSYAQVLRHWQNDAEFRSMFMTVLANAPFSAFRWETPPLTLVTASRPFEFVLLDSPGLGRPADVNAFAKHFVGAAAGGVVDFPNLGHDAILVVPCPTGSLSAFGHLAAFVRQASEAHKHALWERVGAAMERRLNNKPVWLSTAGAGVPWLHVRLDDCPKYYGYQPYREAVK